MYPKMFYLVSFVVVLALTGGVQAADINWSGGGADRDWATPENWEGGVVPGTADKAIISKKPGPILTTDEDINYLNVSDGDPGVMTIDGGSMLVNDQTVISIADNAEGTLNMFSGSYRTSQHMNMSWRGKATLNLYDGHFQVATALNICNKDSSDSLINLYGGTLDVGSINPGTVGQARVNVQAGTLIVNGDDTTAIQGYIDEGRFYAYKGAGILHLDYDETNSGKTTLTGTHPLNPSPVDASIVSPGDVELGWTLPDSLVPDQPVLVDVYFTDDYDTLNNFLNPDAIRVVDQKNVTSVVVQTELKKRYYWAVDTYIGDPNDPIFGPIFSFLADNAPPKVNAGPDVDTILLDGVRTGPLNGIVTDDGQIQPYTVEWTVISEPDEPNLPDAVIADHTAEQTTVTLSAEGTYVLQLEAYDGEYTGSDTIMIYVNPDDWKE